MGLINWVFDFYQHYRIDQIQKETNEARVEAAMRNPAGGVDSEKLETAIGELALALRTLQRLMLDKGVCSAEEMHQKLQQVDLEDGKADGRSPI